MAEIQCHSFSLNNAQTKREEKSNINMNNLMDTSPDILLGAYLMTHLRNACENCGTTNTPQWRKGWYSGTYILEIWNILLFSTIVSRTQPCCLLRFVTFLTLTLEILNRSVLLCNACGIKWAKKQFCPHCNYIYGKEVDKQSDAWLVCTSCSRWVHFDCEKRHREEMGVTSPLSLYNGQYFCSGCHPYTLPLHAERPC